MATERAIARRDPQQAVEEYRKSGVNLILPAQTLSLTTPTHTMAFYPVPVSPNPSEGDIWKVGSVKVGENYEPRYALSKTPLERIAVTAGIVWDPRHTRPLQVSEQFVVFQAVGLVRTPSGEVITLTGTKELWMDAVEDEMRAEQTEKVAGRGTAYDDLTEKQRGEVDRRSRKEFISFRRHRMARAETGAKLRAIRSIGLKSQMSIKEIERGFVVGRCVPNYDNSDVRDEMKKSIMSLYPGDDGGDEGRGPFMDAEDAESEDIPETPSPQDEEQDPPSGPAQAEISHQEATEQAPAGNGNEAGTKTGSAYPDSYIAFISAMRNYESVLGVKDYKKVLAGFDLKSRSEVDMKDTARQVEIVAAMQNTVNATGQE